MHNHSHTLSPQFPDTARDHVVGRLDAPVQMIEYGDFQCPYCGEAFRALKKSLRELEGQLCFGFRHFPLPQHSFARLAAEAAEAAAGRDLFWQMHDALFEHQRTLSEDEILRLVERLGMDTNQFVQDVKGGVYSARISEDLELGSRGGVDGTPVFFVNGFRLEEAPTAEEIAEIANSLPGSQM